jgi:hypothetical protein
MNGRAGWASGIICANNDPVEAADLVVTPSREPLAFIEVAQLTTQFADVIAVNQISFNVPQR